MTEAERARRNLHPHAEARLAMWLWSQEYCQQNGGSMDFWDGLSQPRKTRCHEMVSEILQALEDSGRAWATEADTPSPPSAA